MPGENNVLVICREPGDLPLVNKLKDRSQQSVIIASDNIHVQQAVARKPWVSKVCFIEQIESLYTVADDGMRIQTAINQWLASLATDGEGVPKSLLYFVKHAEGGMTTQRIQDALLLIRSYQALFRESSASRVILRRRISSRWEDDVLVHTARSGGLEVEEHHSILYCIGQKLNLVAVDRYLLGRIRRVYVPSRLINLMRQARLYINVVRAKLNPRNRAEVGDGRLQIAFLLGASTDKHVDNIVPLMMEFQRRGTYQPLAVCWSAANGAAKVRSHALQAYELEASFPLSRLRKLLQRVHRTQARAHAKKDELRDNSSLMYESVALAPLLRPSFDYFLGFQVVNRLFLYAEAESYFGRHKPVAIKTWGDSVLDLGAVCRDVMHRMWKPPSLIFHYSLSAGPDWPYAAHNSDLYLAADERDKYLLVSHGADPRCVTVTGQARYDHLVNFQQRYDKQNSREILGLPSKSKLYVFYALGIPIRGFESDREYFTVASRIFECFSEHSHYILIVKPHPSDSSNLFDPLKRLYPSSNTIFWYDKGMTPYHCINAADVVVTKLSTVGIEAMLLGVPLISIALDGESRFQEIYGDVVEIFTTIEDLLAFLMFLGEGPQNRLALEERQYKFRQEFLKQRFAQNEKSAAETMADAVEEYLRRKDNLSSVGPT